MSFSRYTMNKDSPETFSLHLDIVICFEPDNNCELEIEIFNETAVHRQQCEQAPGFLNSCMYNLMYLKRKKRLSAENNSFFVFGDSQLCFWRLCQCQNYFISLNAYITKFYIMYYLFLLCLMILYSTYFTTPNLFCYKKKYGNCTLLNRSKSHLHVSFLNL